MSADHRFAASASFRPAEKEGLLANGDVSFSAPFSGAPSLGGKTGVTNPEELLLGAILACFVQTWAIFLAKLKLPVAHPRVDGVLELDKDPAGGYRVVSVSLSAHVPGDLLASRAEEVGKSLALAEKYCIVSKAVHGEGLSFTVTPTSA